MHSRHMHPGPSGTRRTIGDVGAPNLVGPVHAQATQQVGVNLVAPRRLAVMMYIRFPLSLRQAEYLLHERGIDIWHETVRAWWNRIWPMFAAEIRKRRVALHRNWAQWWWHLNEVFVWFNGEIHYLSRAVDHEGEVLQSRVTKRRDREAALKFLRKSLKRHGNPQVIVTDKLWSYGAAMKIIGNAHRQKTERWLNNRAENSHQPFRPRERAMAKFTSEASVQKLLPFTPPFTIISTWNDIYATAKSSSSTAPKL